MCVCVCDTGKCLMESVITATTRRRGFIFGQHSSAEVEMIFALRSDAELGRHVFRHHVSCVAPFRV